MDDVAPDSRLQTEDECAEACRETRSVEGVTRQDSGAQPAGEGQEIGPSGGTSLSSESDSFSSMMLCKLCSLHGQESGSSGDFAHSRHLYLCDSVRKIILSLL